MTYGLSGDSPRRSAHVFKKSVSIAAISVAFTMAFTALPSPVVAQAFSFNNVSIEGNQRIEPGTILSYAGIARGAAVSAAGSGSAFPASAASAVSERLAVASNRGRLHVGRRQGEYHLS